MVNSGSESDGESNSVSREGRVGGEGEAKEGNRGWCWGFWGGAVPG